MKTVTFLLIAVVAGCTAQSPIAFSRTDSIAPPESRALAQPTAAVASYDAGAASELAAPAFFTMPLDAPPAMMIRTGQASIEVDSLEPALALLRDLAGRTGGYVGDVSIQSGAERQRTATLEIKVPAAHFDETLAGLRPIGKVEAVTVGAQDVGEEYVDVGARMENARRLEQRLIAILAERTGKLKDVLDVEQTLARVREEIERYEGRLRYLRAHAAVSTLAVTLHEPFPIVGPVGTSVMGEAARQAWRNFVMLCAAVVASLGWAIPLGALGFWGFVAARRWRKPLQSAS